MTSAKVNGQSIYFVKEGKGKTLFLLHDILEDHTHFHEIINSLKTDLQVIAVDFRGSGQSASSKEDFKVEDLAKDIVALADHLKLDKFHVLGDSFGGAVAQMIAYKHPDRVEKLILSNAFIKISNASCWYLEIAADLLKQKMSYEDLYKLTLPWFYSSWFLDFKDDVEKLLKEASANSHPVKHKDYLKQLGALKQFDSTRWLKKISCKTLIIMGEEDLFVLFKESRAFTTKIENYEVELCPGGHKSKRECPTRYLEVVRKFLSEPPSDAK